MGSADFATINPPLRLPVQSGAAYSLGNVPHFITDVFGSLRRFVINFEV